MEIFIIICLVLIVLILYSIMREIYDIRRDVYYWREDWETMNKFSVKKKSLKEQAGIIKKIVSKLIDKE